jgi:glycosyltransferase involved in cell wall biosynthesis
MIICFPHPPGSGGPGSFQSRFELSLKRRGWKIEYKSNATKPDIIFVVGGTRHLFWLLQMKLKAIPVIYRLDGISWLHRKKKVGFKRFMLAEYRNLLGKIIHGFIADKIIYQSLFVKDWWNRSGFRKRENTTIIYNGVVIPKTQLKFDTGTIRLVILEGNIDYSPYAIKLINELAGMLKDKIAVLLYGRFEFKENEKILSDLVDYRGFVKRVKVFDVLSGSIYLSLDINPACPNTVIEALAYGAPVVAFDTGSLKELVPPEAGIIVPYGSDPWQLTYPDVDALVHAILKVKENYAWYSANARKVAEERYSIEDMTKKYLEVINQVINK